MFFPLRNLVRMNLMFSCQFGQGFHPANCFQSNLGLKFIRKFTSFFTNFHTSFYYQFMDADSTLISGPEIGVKRTNILRLTIITEDVTPAMGGCHLLNLKLTVWMILLWLN
ncbi:protein of unknown function [Maridesulfovibrio hydrothermalis AM13 = DSM 14728]|uniref:Uncharacterized protein n=1 Tax=Maridesulfovibrio hydrothermalis AM13 = DSM 14728 TaxID=1121451 RepID=L0R6B5_9BACT|nr:protein of unknown function [Maridesulfovibrio hydrothermalis AM13 = DSM 14728]